MLSSQTHRMRAWATCASIANSELGRNKSAFPMPNRLPPALIIALATLVSEHVVELGSMMNPSCNRAATGNLGSCAFRRQAIVLTPLAALPSHKQVIGAQVEQL